MGITIFLDALLFFFYSLTFVFIVWYILNHIKSGWNAESFFLVIFLLFYVIIPMSFIINNGLFLHPFQDPDIELYPNEYSTYSFASFSMMLIFLFFFFLGVHLASSKQYVLDDVEERYIDVSIFKISLLKVSGIFFSILSFASMFIYASQFGGFEQTIYYADWVNAGALEEVALSTKYIFVQRFIYLSILSFIIYIFIKEKKNLFYTVFLLIIPLGTTLFSRAFLFSGKESIIEIFLLLLLYKSIKDKSSYIIQTLLFAVILYFALPIMDILLASKQDQSNIAIELLSPFKFLEYFTFPQIGLEFALNRKYDFFFFYDFIYGLRGNIIPSSWLSTYSLSSFELNTFYFTKEYKSVVPPGVLAFSYYSFGIIGILFMGLLSGFIVRKLDNLFIRMREINVSFSIFYALFIGNIFTFVRTGIPRLNIYETTLVVSILLMLISFKFHFKKKALSYE